MAKSTITYASTAAVQEIASKVKALLAEKVDKVTGKGLSTNDLTNELKTNYDAAYTHSQADHAPANAERNVIVGLTMNGTAVTVDSDTRIAAITMSTNLSDYNNTTTDFQSGTQVSNAISTALADYSTTTEMNAAIAAAVAGASHLKYEIVSVLPTSDISDTTIYLVPKATAEGENAYTEWMYIKKSGSEHQWEKIGDTMVDMTQYYTKTQTDDAITAALADYLLNSDFTEITAAQVDGYFAS